MNFFESQDRARKNTSTLVFLFALAVITLIIMTNLLVMVVFGFIGNDQLHSGTVLIQKMDWQRFALISAAVVTVVLAGSLYKIMALSGGGKTVADALGGRLIPQNTDDLKQRRLLNVVEEMAIASGIPAPPVYILAGEPGINAFAAGFTPRDAVIGVTQGLINHLSREQLQGVIAHEFSHIFNGDMRLNIRLIGVLNGILIIGLAGYYILRTGAYSGRSRNNKNSGGILGLAIGLMVIGFAGTFFGNLIKAAVSRQREYLADASAVQFTRNPEGIAGALKRIGGLGHGSIVENPGAPEISHAFFAQGVSGLMQSLFATHPPLENRIRAIDPHWDGKFATDDETDLHQNEEQPDKKTALSREELARKAATAAVGATMATVSNAIGQVGNPMQETLAHARTLIAGLPEAITEAVHEPYGARAVIYSFLLDHGQEVRDRQLMHLRQHADPDVFALTQKLMPDMGGLDIKYRLPLIDMATPALKQLSIGQYQSFKKNLIALIEMDSQIDLLEWSLRKILFTNLDGHFFKPAPPKVRYSNIRDLRQEARVILSVMAYSGQQQQNDVEAAFHAAAVALEFGELELREKNRINVADLDMAMDKLEMLNPLAKPKLLKACAVSVMHDQKMSAVEAELLRAIASVLGCPMPPIIA
ncbi:MAG: M48 family metallopeptidase [Gallionella sp.]|nr:M48 family metallopeptidase [Gallionella sp.]